MSLPSFVRFAEVLDVQSKTEAQSKASQKQLAGPARPVTLLGGPAIGPVVATMLAKAAAAFSALRRLGGSPDAQPKNQRRFAWGLF